MDRVQSSAGHSRGHDNRWGSDVGVVVSAGVDGHDDRETDDAKSTF